MCYKILQGLVDIKSSCFHKRSLYDSTRANLLKLATLHVIWKRDKNLFTNRVINIWNVLLDSIVTSSSLSSFKRNIARFDLSRYLLFYWSYVLYTYTIVLYRRPISADILSALVILSIDWLIDMITGFLLLYLCMFFDIIWSWMNKQTNKQTNKQRSLGKLTLWRMI